MGFEWNKESEQGAQLLANGELSQDEIANSVGVSRTTLWRWRQEPEFQARVTERLEALREEVRRHGVAIVERRVARVHDTWRRLQRVIEARATDLAHVPGGNTGLLVRKTKMLGAGPMAREIEEYELDTGLLAELRAHEKQAAEELGQWLTRTDVQSKGEALQSGTTVILLPHKELHADDQATAGPADDVPGGDE